MYKKILCLVAVLIVALAGSAEADFRWFGGWAGDNNFLTVGNWLGGDPKNQDDVINQGHTVNLTAPPDYSINSLTLGKCGVDVMNTLNMNGGYLVVSDDVVVGDYLAATGDGTLNMNDGEIIATKFYVGRSADGTINLNDGTLYPWDLLQMGGNGGTGLVNLDDGLLHLNNITMYEGSSIVITDGTLQVDALWGDPVPKVNQYINNGWIVPGEGYTLQTELFDNGQGGEGIRVTATISTPPILGWDYNWGRVFEDRDGKKWVLWGVDVDVWCCDAGNVGKFEDYCASSNYVNANCIAVPITWKMIEGSKGIYDFTYFDQYINLVRQYGLKATILWVGIDYAAGDISFVPSYITNNTSTYTRITGLHYSNVLCPSCQATLDREKLAYVAMVQHLAQVDGNQHTVMAICSSGEFNYVRALSNWSPPEQNVRCTCSHCNAAYQGGNNVTFMTEQYANYTKTLIEAGAAYYDIPTYSQVCPHKLFPGWRYAENPVMFTNIIDRENHFAAPSVVETSSENVFVAQEMDYFAWGNIPDNPTVFIDGIGMEWSENWPHIEMAPWYSILWYGGVGAIYWDDINPDGELHSITDTDDVFFREKFSAYWAPLKGMHFFLAKFKTSDTIKFWWGYWLTHSWSGTPWPSLQNFSVDQVSSDEDYGVCFELGPTDITFTGSTYSDSYTFTVSYGPGWNGFKFEKGYFNNNGIWIKDSDVYPTINGYNAILTVHNGDPTPDNPVDYTQVVYRYYK